ncbi:MAG: hypothetical protein GY845_38505, partial [Planctomycetes bacterium]|nr:hypothetical protein [Planctomycetota bacterium]
HSITVYGLSPDTEYEYQVSSVDGKNNGPVTSELKSFKTLTLADTKPPVIFGFPDVRVLDTTSVAIIWTTDEQSDSRVEFAPEADQTTFFSKERQTYTKEHIVRLKDLMPGTEYVFNIYSMDAQGNGPAFKGPFSFKTAETADTSPPSWTVWPSVGNVDTSSFILEWGSDERCNSGVQVIDVDAPNDTLGFDDQQLVIKHVIYVGGLQASTTYNVRVYAYDAAGNGPTYSEWFDITTRDQADIDPPKIQGIPQIADVDTNSATIKFVTNEPASYEFEYGLAFLWPNNTTIAADPDFNIVHEVLLTNLMPDTTYRFTMRLADRAGNTWVTNVTKDLRTADKPDNEPPQLIGLVNAAKIGTDKAAVNWITDERSNSVVSYGESSGYPGNAVEISDQDLVDRHWIHIKGLTSDTEYTFTVSSTDGKDNGPTVSDEYTLRTLAAPDTTAPVMIGQPSERDIDTTFVNIIWGTDEPANSIVVVMEYDDTSKVLNMFDGDFVTEHAI